MEFKNIPPGDFPSGHGSRHRSNSEFWDLLQRIKAMEIRAALKVGSIGSGRGSAFSLRRALLDELKTNRGKFDIVCRLDQAVNKYDLYVRRKA